MAWPVVSCGLRYGVFYGEVIVDGVTVAMPLFDAISSRLHGECERAICQPSVHAFMHERAQTGKEGQTD